MADIAVGTMGKALGLFGAIIFLPTVVKEYLLNFSAPLIYSTALPEAHAASAIDLLELIADYDHQRSQLMEISCYLKTGLEQKEIAVSGDSHIISVEVGNEGDTMKIQKRLLENRILIFPVRYPTVPLGKSILRLSLTALHTREDLDVFIDCLDQAYGEVVR